MKNSNIITLSSVLKYSLNVRLNSIFAHLVMCKTFYMLVSYFKKSLSIILFLSSCLLYSQSIPNTIQRYIDAHIIKTDLPDIQHLFSDKNIGKSLEVLNSYALSSNDEERNLAFHLLGIIGSNATDSNARMEATRMLGFALQDSISSINQTSLKALKKFNKSDFHQLTIRKLMEYAHLHKQYTSDAVELLGFVLYAKETPDLVLQTDLLLKPFFTPQEQWKGKLALARLGSNEYITSCVTMIKSLPLNDALVYDVLPELVYIRQKEAFDYLFQIIMSDDKKCMPPNPEFTNKIICGYRVIEMLAPYVIDFPITLKTSGSINGDYTEAMKTTRNWYKQHKDNYQLKKDIF